MATETVAPHAEQHANGSCTNSVFTYTPWMLLPDEFRISDHALAEMERRGLDIASVTQTIASPEQVVAVRFGKIVCQSRVESGTRLLRVIVDVDRTPAVVVTAYRTSNLRKYWQQP